MAYVNGSKTLLNLPPKYMSLNETTNTSFHLNLQAMSREFTSFYANMNAQTQTAVLMGLLTATLIVFFMKSTETITPFIRKLSSKRRNDNNKITPG